MTMIRKLVALLYILQNVFCMDLATSGSPNKSLNKARLKTSRIVNPIETAVDSGNIHAVLEPYFPEVTYPTSILEVAQPFYFSQRAHEDVLAPFPNDVKSSYKNIASGKANIPSTDYSYTRLNNRKTTASLNRPSTTNNDTCNTINIELDNSSLSEDSPLLNTENVNEINSCTFINETVTANDNLYSIETQYIEEGQLHDTPEEANVIDENSQSYLQVEYVEEKFAPAITETHMTYTESEENSLEADTIDDINKNLIYEANVTPNYFVTSNMSNILHETVSLETINNNETYYANFTSNDNESSDGSSNQTDTESLDFNIKNSTYIIHVNPNNVESPDTNNDLDDTETSETKNSNMFCVNLPPNYVVTSKTGNTPEDFANDLMNIYSLIEETLRAVSVVEFVVSNCIQPNLGLKENENKNVAYTYKTEFINS